MGLSKWRQADADNISAPKHTQPTTEVMMPEEDNNNQNPEIIQPRIKNKIRKETHVFGKHIVEHQKRDGRFKDDPLPLPFWGPTERGVPNGLLRSAIFGMVHSGQRALLNNEPLFTCGSTAMRFSGEELDQKDCDVFMALLEMVQEQGSYRARCSFYALRKMLSAAKGKNNTDALKASIMRLNKAFIEMDSPGAYYAGNLLDSFTYSEKEDTYIARINPELAFLFNDGYARLRVETRILLRSDLARFLHGLVLSHEAPYHRPQTYKIETIHSLSRSKEKLKRKFRAKVKQSMEQLKKHSILLKWSVSKEDILSFVRKK